MTNIDAALEEFLSKLQDINHNMAELKKAKEAIERKIMERVGAACFDSCGQMTSLESEGTTTHTIGNYKARVKTDYIYSLDKEEYKILKDKVSKEFNPVKEIVKYELNKKAIKECEMYGSAADITLMNEFISKKFAKPSINLTANV